jgi:hypothetical protein
MKRFFLSLMFFVIALGVFPAALFAQLSFREIESVSKPETLERKSPRWNGVARIVGQVKNPPPVFWIDLQCLDGKPTVKTFKFSGELSVYETDWIPPGKYSLTIRANGYKNYSVTKPPVVVQPGSDCLINIVFGITDYSRR